MEVDIAIQQMPYLMSFVFITLKKDLSTPLKCWKCFSLQSLSEVGYCSLFTFWNTTWWYCININKQKNPQKMTLELTTDKMCIVVQISITSVFQIKR